LVVDQITKAVVRATMHDGDSFGGFIPYVINLTLVRNSGAAFGLFPGQRPVFLLTSALVLFVIAAYWRRARPHQWPVVIALAMVAGGSVGNLIDRALVGHVTDFFEFAFVQFPVFNVADIGIVGGVGVLMAWVLLGPETPAAPAEVGDAEPCADGATDVGADSGGRGDVAAASSVGEPAATEASSTGVGRAES
jgi:signal peptidase II